MMPTIRIPISTIPSLFPACELGGVGVGLVLPGVGFSVFGLCTISGVGLIFRVGGIVLCKNRGVGVGLMTSEMGKMDLTP